MAEKSVADKARVKPATTFAVLNPEPGIMASLHLPESVSFVGPQQAQIVCVFVRTRAELDAELPAAENLLPRSAALWVFFRKGSKAAGHDVNRDDVWAAAEGLDLRPLGLISVDASWSVFRFRRA
jgi:hypothetical protein